MRFFTGLAIAGIGAAGGLVAALITFRSLGASDAKTPRKVDERLIAQDSERMVAPRRFAVVPAPLPPAASSASTAASDDPESQARNGEPQDPKVTGAARRAQFQEEIAFHSQDSTDFDWAGSVETDIQGDLDDLTEETDIRVQKVECRTTSCIAVLQWPSYAEAQQTFRRFLALPHAGECGSKLILPEVESQREGDPVEATVLFQCERE
jgi:hypothetical protein